MTTSNTFNKLVAIANLQLNESNTSMLVAIIQNETEMEDFKMNFLNDTVNKEEQTFASLAYREHRIDCNNYSCEEFCNDFLSNKIGALQRLFMEEVIQEDVERLQNWMIREEKTLHDLYNEHMKKPYKSLLSHLL